VVKPLYLTLPLKMARVTMNCVHIKVDKSGRIVLPKPVRERLRLRAGTNLELQEVPEGILLRPVGQRPALVWKDGFLVHLGKAPRGLNWNRLIEDSREDRIKDVAGL
jgi:AbrB family looped-hinge helix DNA binding protein